LFDLIAYFVQRGREANAGLLLFAFLLALLSGFGQTFFIGLFSADFRAASGLASGTFGTLYSAATLAGAVLLYWAGGVIDRVSMRAYASGAACLLALGCMLVAFADQILLLAAGLLLLRFSGQGLLSHAAVVSTARAFDRARGRALTVALFGHPAGEATLPPLAAALATQAGYRNVWFFAALLLLALVPLLYRLGERRAVGLPQAVSQDGNGTLTGVRHASRKEVLRDPTFFLLLPALIVPGFIVTGMFIHQDRLLIEKSWSVAWFAATFVAFATTHVGGMISAGFLIDRFGARRLMSYYVVPLAAACLLVAFFDHPVALLLFMAGMGISVGGASSVGGALWAELYGITHLGAIRAAAASAAVISTAIAPAFFGWSIDFGVSMSAIAIACAVLVMLTIGLAVSANGRRAIR
jgi:MFS family permease